VAFLRGEDVLVAVSRWTVRLGETGWGATTIGLPSGTWTDRIAGQRHQGRVLVADLFADMPVALLERGDG
jgi:(1->4)-alpha-D-glucan 1-alpha-D-glucosylmutase